MTLRLRLTVLYGVLFLISGAALLTITYLLVARQYSGNFFVISGTGGGPDTLGVAGVDGIPPSEVQTQIAPDPAQLVAQAHDRTSAALHQLLLQSGLALAIMAILSIWLGWIVAGRALRPLRTITNAAREISASNLHRRLELAGPDDELNQLGTTFNGLLERLETSFDAQRQFAANASHELRTPLTLERTLVEVALANPDATADTLRETCLRVIAAGKQQERLIEALLTLSRSQRGLDRHEPFDLGDVTSDVLTGARAEARRGRIAIGAELGAAPTSGDPRLGERLVANLVDNAIRHNAPGGSVVVTTATTAGHAVLRVSNTGPSVPPAEIERLLQPFQRLSGGRNHHDDSNGVGLGLSIVHAIASAHEAALTARALPEGGLEVEVRFALSGEPVRERAELTHAKWGSTSRA